MGVFILFVCKSLCTTESFFMMSWYHIIISSYHYMIISSYHHINISSSSKSVSQFWAKSQQKNRKSSLNPLTKERRDLIFWGNGVIFRGESAVYAQKFVAPPKRAIFDLMLHFWSENFIKKIIGRRKIKCRESSETRFGKVSRRSEPSSRGKRPIEKTKKRANERTRCRKLSGGRRSRIVIDGYKIDAVKYFIRGV